MQKVYGWPSSPDCSGNPFFIKRLQRKAGKWITKITETFASKNKIANFKPLLRIFAPWKQIDKRK